MRERRAMGKRRCEACGKMADTLSDRFVGENVPLYAMVCPSCDALDYAELRYRWDHWRTYEDAAERAPGGNA